MASNRLVLRFARRFLRNPAFRSSVLVVAAVAAFLVVSFATQQAMTLTPSQAKERDIGSFENRLDGLATLLPGQESDELARSAEHLLAEHSIDAVVTISSISLETNRDQAPRISYLEYPWTARHDSLAGRYELLDGRWPVKPGEVAIADHRSLSTGESLQLLSSRIEFTIVGTVEDKYAKFPTALAAPGTWASLDPSIAEDFDAAVGQPALLWNGPETTLPLVADALGIADTTTSELVPRFQSVHNNDFSGGKPWLERNPTGFFVPLILLPGFAVSLATAIGTRRTKNSLSQLSTLGAPSAISQRILVTSLGLSIVGSTAFGLAIGGLVSVGARQLLGVFYWQPLAPISGLTRALLAISASIVGWALVAGIASTRSTAISTNLPDRPKQPSNSKRRYGAFAGLLLALVQAAQLSSGPATLALAGTVAGSVALLTPDIADQVLSLNTPPGAKERLAHRLMSKHSRMVGTAVSVLALLFGLSTGMLLIIETATIAENEQLLPPAGKGQLGVHGSGGALEPATDNLLNVVARSAAMNPNVTQTSITFLGDDDTWVYANSDGFGFVWTVEDSETVSSMLGRPLLDHEKQTLENGGLLSIDGHDKRERVLYRSNQSGTLDAMPPVPSVRATFEHTQLTASFDAVTLTNTAERMGLPERSGGDIFYPMGPTAVDSVVSAVIDAGQSERNVSRYAEPGFRPPPVAVVAAAITLFALVAAASGVIARAQTAELASIYQQLGQIGAPSRWIYGLVLRQQLVILSLSIGIGMFVALAPVVVAVVKIDGFSLIFPWRWLVPAVVVFIAANTATTLVSTRRAMASERRYS